MTSKQKNDPGLEALNKLLRASSKEESKTIITAVRKYIREHANDLKHCPMCSNPIHDVITTYTKETAEDVVRILYRWSTEKGRHEFKIGDVKHLLDKTQYANMNHLVAFKGIFYRPINKKNGRPYTSTYYGIHRGRAEEFLRGQRPGPIQIRRNRFTHERVDESEGKIGEHPHVAEMVDTDGIYKAPTLL